MNNARPMTRPGPTQARESPFDPSPPTDHDRPNHPERPR
jgi:hypothetical protein